MQSALLCTSCMQHEWNQHDQQTNGEACRAASLFAVRSTISCALQRKTLRINNKTWSLAYAHAWAPGFLSRVLGGGRTVAKGKTSDLQSATVGFCLLTTRNEFPLKLLASASDASRSSGQNFLLKIRDWCDLNDHKRAILATNSEIQASIL
jgi:hypothetical protein